MDDAIRDMLDILEAAEDAGLPLSDTDLRERLSDVVDRGFIREETGYQVPAGLLDDCGGDEEQRSRVGTALSTFLAHARRHAAAAGLDTPETRQAAFLDSEVCSSSGATSVSDFFN